MNTRAALPCLVLASLLAACGAPEPKPPEPEPRAAVEPTAVPIDPVDQLLALAGRSTPAEAVNLRLEAAIRLLDRNETDRALAAIAPLARARLAPLQQARRAWVLARVDLARSDPAAALARLSAPEVLANAGGDRTLAAGIRRTYAAALLDTGHDLSAAQELAALQPWLVTDAEREANARALLQALARVPGPELGAAIAEANAEDWRGWLELAAAVRDISATPARQRAALQQWRTRYVALAALETATRSVLPALESRIANPSRVAVLLPLSGRAAASGQAVLHGYLAERFRQLQSGDPPPPVAVIDTAAEPGGFPAAYQRALTDGAALVVGPLLKEDLAAFSTALEVKAPTLALNFIDQHAPEQGGLYQFGIDIDDELNQLVASARGAGYTRMVTLASDDERTRRLATAFDSQWQRGGGTSLGTLYLGDLNDYRARLESTLLLRQSEQRAGALQRLLGVPLATEPRRRGDLDLFVLLADPTAARSIRSLLTYLYAGDGPTWGTSLTRAYDARTGNLDLEGVRFLDMPWFAPREAELREDASGTVAPGPMERLFAMGVDAARLQSRLGLLEWNPESGLRGATGELSADAGNRIRRRSEWYLVRDGNAEAQSGDEESLLPESTDGDTTWTPERPAAAAPPSSAPL